MLGLYLASERRTIRKLPFEVLVNVLSFIPFREKHVVRRVNSVWKAAADAAISKQKRLVVYRFGASEHHSAG